VTLPAAACRAELSGERAALWLGPDEWLLVAPLAQSALALRIERALAGLPHSLVDVSHRQVALLLEGPHAATLLASGCALDLDVAAFPVGMCARTMLAKAEVLLWRTGALSFRLEVWRSFAPYVTQFLGEAARGII
jgi:sarcosine oxidase subunit gamma